MAERMISSTPLLKDRITEELREWVTKTQSSKRIRIESERVLAERFGVSRLVLRAAVQTLVEEGYVVQIRGSGTYIVPKSKLDHVGIVCAPDIRMDDPIYFQLLEEITNSLAMEQIVLSNIHVETIDVKRDSMLPVIIMGQLDVGSVRRIMENHRYVISLQSYPRIPELIQVYNDDYKIGLHAAQVLVEHGHRWVVHLAGPSRFPAPSERRRGFTEALVDTGLSADVLDGKMNWKGGCQLATEFIGRFQRDRPTGVFAANDWMALGFIRTLNDAGIRVPDEVSVIGCDDIHLAEEIEPHLSTFRLNTRNLVREVFALLNVMLFSEDSHEGKRILIPATYIERDTLKTIR